MAAQRSGLTQALGLKIESPTWGKNMKAVLAFVIILFSASAHAQVYTCSDGRGGKVYQQTPCSGTDSGSNETSAYVRCIKPNGSTYIHRGASCPARTETVQHQPGMVTDVRTGQQHFMVPGGGNGMIDPRTGQRHELISPQPTRRVQDSSQPISQAEACAEARRERDRALSDYNRTMTKIRAAEAKYERLCGN